MQHFLVKTAKIACIVLLLAAVRLAAAADTRPYELVLPPVLTDTPEKVKVVELFWYSCPHCYHFDPHIEKWLETKADYIEFTRMPAVYSNPDGLNLAKAFYTAEALDVLDTLHKALFDAWHRDKKRFQSDKALRDFFVAHGVSAEDFNRTFGSFGVAMKIRQARALTAQYGVSEVPTIVVNGKYRVKSGQAGGYKKMLQLIDELAAKEWATMRAATEEKTESQEGTK